MPGVRGANGLLPESVSTDVGTAAAARPPEPLFGDPDDTTVGAAAPAVGGPARSAAVHPEALPPPDYVGTPALPQPPVNMPELPAPVPTPSTPYYFIAESSPYRSAGEVPGLDTLAGAALDPAHVEPPAMNTVGGAIGAVPGAVTTGRPESGPWSGIDNPAAAPSPTSPAFYFADRAAPGNRSASDQISGLGRDAHPPFDVRLIRRDFPILSERVNGKPLVWLDNAATTQKPQAVLDRLTHFYRHENSNIHRAAHELAARATDAYEGARKTVARFIGAESEKDIVFVRGATEAINLVAKSWGKANVRRGDEIILSHLEHHANIVPWQQLIAETGARLRVIPVDDSGQILLDEYGKLLSSRTKLVAVTQVSNALGTVTPGRVRSSRWATGPVPAC